MPPTQLSQTMARTAAVTAAFATVAVVAMIGITIANGVGFQDFESLLRFDEIEIYTQNIAKAAPVLRTLYPIDTLYVLSYVIMTFAIIHLAPERSVFGNLAGGIVVILALLDLVENNHIIAMASAAERGLPIAAIEVTIEHVITQVKFNTGLLLTLSLSFLFPQIGRISVFASWFARAVVVFAPIALLNPVTTLIYLSMNVIFAGILTVMYATVARSGLHSAA